MVESSKILTVSYGTFSCTLEGFDDSFGTMKAIAEYFRDLAAGDRYFGAEPPTPDAEMLAHIAEREIARRVEARTDETGIVLRAAAALAPTPEETADASADDGMAVLSEVETVTEEAEAPAADDRVAEADEAVEEIDAVAEAADLDDPELDAEELEESLPDTTMMAEAVVEEASQTMPPEAKRPDDAPAIHELAAATDSALPEDSAATEAAAQTPDAPEEETPPLLAVSEPAAQAEAETPVKGPHDITFVPTSFDDMETSALTEVPVHPDADSVAAKLQRIRAVVGKTPELAEDDGLSDEGYAEDIPTPAMADHDGIAAVLAADDVDMEDTAPEDEADLNVMGFEEIVPDPEDDGMVEDVAETGDDAVAELSEAVSMAEEMDADAADIEAMDTADSDDFDADPEMAEAEGDAPDSVAEAEAEAEEASAEVAEEEIAPRKPTLRARILRVARPKAAALEDVAAAEDVPDATDADAAEDMTAEDVADASEVDAVDDGHAEDLPDVAALDGADDLAALEANVAATLSPEDEADLQRDLQSVSADMAEPAMDEADDADAAIAEDEADEVEAATPQRHTLPEADDAEMARIMDQADAELSNPEGSRRRNAIAQLKAAVAATEAARQLGDNTDAAAEAENAFREDLDQVVRPRRARPQAENRSERPRPAPLKLVASQRVDIDQIEAPETPVRPRRVATADIAPQSDAGSFAEFAEEMGAKELPDLLEAAAAYTAFVEGNEDFSRPQIMKKVQLTASESFSREDGLRSFGTLLRQGRISKVRNGRFQVSDRTRFKPEQKAG